jgi:hypothetical protein
MSCKPGQRIRTFKLINVDWDDWKENRKLYLALLKRFIEENGNIIKSIRIRTSASGKGKHLQIETKEEIDFLSLLLYRAILGDDAYHIKADLERYYQGQNVNRLWDIKIKNGKILRAGKWKEWKI